MIILKAFDNTFINIFFFYLINTPSFRFFTLRLIFNTENINIIEPIQFMQCTSPVWNDSSHVSSNKSVLLNLLIKSSDYFESIHSKIHFGDT